MTERRQDVGSRRSRWTEATAAEVLRAVESSGQNLAEYCRAQGLNYERVRRWKLRLAEQHEPAKGSKFLRVQVTKPAAPPEAEAAPGVIELCFGELVIRARGQVSEATLVRVLRAAKAAAQC